MTRERIEASAVIPAPPNVVYGVLADYRVGHPAILPKPEFQRLEVLDGGTGAGTKFRLTLRVMGTTRVSTQTVTEPEPGRVLVEASEAEGLATTFTVDSVNGGQQSRVTITTEWTPRPGLAGWIEKALTPRALRPLYERELAQLAEYVRGK
jgi:hypothetical protein